uniref:Uncharacterized protein n=1 Tax=Lepeophtheirus salmonis TaxID=72036 RepID=A0A0K2UX06_LEPSM
MQQQSGGFQFFLQFGIILSTID